MIYALLDVVTDSFAYSAIACVSLAIIGLGLMVSGIVRSNTPRAWSIGLLLVGVAYAAANIGVFVLTISVDAFVVFDLAYILSAALVGPALMMIGLILVARVYKQPGWLCVAGFVIWTGCVGFAHLWVIAAASASV